MGSCILHAIGRLSKDGLELCRRMGILKCMGKQDAALRRYQEIFQRECLIN